MAKLVDAGGFLVQRLGNLGDRSAVPALEWALADADPAIRAHAAWALGRLGGKEARRALERARPREQTAAVEREIDSALGKV